jgi:Tc5 transposase DNA-binding domain
MPRQKPSGKAASRQAIIGPEVEKLIQEACMLLCASEKPNYTTVIKDIQERTGTLLPYHTVRNRFRGKHVPPRQAHASQQLLSPEAESVLVDWITFLSGTGHPLSKRTIRKKAEALCGKKPSESWIRYFLGRHLEIKLGKPSGLDPKRAQAFNRPVVNRHFDLLIQIIQESDIPVENIYNMDEKGCQRGGGRKNSGRKYFVHRARRPRYKAHSGNLELVTIIECVCANGTYLLPGFVFSGKEFSPEWFK